MAIEIKVAPDVSLLPDRFAMPLLDSERAVHRRLIVFKGVHHYNFRLVMKMSVLGSLN